jgi:hypothetical protein
MAWADDCLTARSRLTDETRREPVPRETQGSRERRRREDLNGTHPFRKPIDHYDDPALEIDCEFTRVGCLD